MKRARFLALVGLILLALSGVAMAKFPEKPVTVIVPFGVGGGSDTFVRALQQPLSRALGVPVVVENIAGAGGVKGMVEAFNRPADGYTILQFTSSHLIASVAKRSEVDILKDFEVLCRGQQDLSVLWVSPNSQFKTFQELVDWAKANPKRLTIGGTSPGGFDDLRARVFAKNFGIEITFVPFEGAAQIVSAILGGFLVAHLEEPLAISELVKAGKARPLVVFAPKRIDILPDVPAVKEFGVEDYMGVFRAFAVKKGTPPEAVKVLSEALKKALNDPEYLSFAEKTLYDVKNNGYMDGPAFLEEMKKHAEFFSKVI